MDLELIFSVASVLSMIGWLILLASPFNPHWSDRIAGFAIPLILSAGYVTLIIIFPSDGDGGFGSLAEVAALFSHENAVLAGWVHYLAFDLLIGAWICRSARRENLSFWLVVPCLPLTFLLGPAGFLAFFLMRLFGRARTLWN